jgi:hypothetical protein
MITTICSQEKFESAQRIQGKILIQSLIYDYHHKYDEGQRRAPRTAPEAEQALDYRRRTMAMLPPSVREPCHGRTPPDCIENQVPDVGQGTCFRPSSIAVGRRGQRQSPVPTTSSPVPAHVAYRRHQRALRHPRQGWSVRKAWEGEEISTDEHGRIWVQSTGIVNHGVLPVRVAHLGRQAMGMIFIPRIGMRWWSTS